MPESRLQPVLISKFPAEASTPILTSDSAIALPQARLRKRKTVGTYRWEKKRGLLRLLEMTFLWYDESVATMKFMAQR